MLKEHIARLLELELDDGELHARLLALLKVWDYTGGESPGAGEQEEK